MSDRILTIAVSLLVAPVLLFTLGVAAFLGGATSAACPSPAGGTATAFTPGTNAAGPETDQPLPTEADARSAPAGSTASTQPLPCRPNSPAPGAGAVQALAYARAQLGLPYEWGGNGPPAGDDGYDCSGLTTAAYAAAGITLPRTAQTQFNAGPIIPAGTQPAPGDLVFFGDDTRHVTHVGIVTTPGHMIDAPHRGAVIRRERIWTSRLLGYSRPAS